MLTHLRAAFRAYTNKIRNRTSGVVHISAVGAKKGDALVSFATQPFTQAPWEFFTDPHTNPWACRSIVRMLAERGYAVDVIDWNNTALKPRKPYAICIDINHNLARLAPHLPPQCIKVLFATGSETSFHNRAEKNRLEALFERRGVRLPPHRQNPENTSPQSADYIVCYGNETVRATFSHFRKPIIPLPTPVMSVFPFPEEKDFATARTSFLWFGGGGAIHKGLDITLEAFVNNPYELHIVGPAAQEPHFKEAYAAELSSPSIHIHPRPKQDVHGNLSIGGEDFLSIMDRCIAVILPSAAEGGGASAVQAMHAGLIPIVTPESGIPDGAPAHIVKPTPDSIREAVQAIAISDPATLQQQSRDVWQFARTHCTKDAFMQTWSTFFDEHLGKQER